MHRRTAATRLVALTTLAALAMTLVGTVTVQARDAKSTDRQIRSNGDPAREAAGIRSFRHIDVRNLPAATGKGSSYEPTLPRPGDIRAPAAPDGAGPPPPVQTTSKGDRIRWLDE